MTAEQSSGQDASKTSGSDDRRKSVALARKIGVTVLGIALLATGIAMMVLPGPGLIVIVLGLLVLSQEFEWAEKRLDQARDKALDAAHKTAASKPQTAFALLSSLAIMGAGVFMGLNKTLPGHGWFTGGTLIASGIAAMATVLWSVQDLKKRRSKGA